MAYDSSDIEVLSGLDPVKKRPGMYTDTDRPNHLAQEIIDNSVDEAIAGHASKIEVVHYKDGSISVLDDGRGMPVDLHPEKKRPGVEVVLSTLHAGGKFSSKNYKFSGGLHGVGISVVNALTTRLEVFIKRNGKEYNIAFGDGELKTELNIIGTVPKRETGTKLHFWPDPQYFDTIKFSIKRLKHVLRAKAVLCPGLHITFTDEATEEKIEWMYEKGLHDYIVEAVGDAICLPDEPFIGTTTTDEQSADWAVMWLPEGGEGVSESYVNLIPTIAGGTHVNGLRTGLTEAMREFCDFRNLLPRGVKIAPEDVWDKLSFVLSIKLLDPQFAGQTKERLSSREAAAFVTTVMKDSFSLWLNANPKVGEEIAQFVINNAQSRQRAGKKVIRKRVTSGPALPGKLADCASQDLKRTELFLVEGDSAGGCWAQNTLISLPKDDNETIGNMAKRFAEGEEYFIYTYRNSTSKVELAKVKNVWETKITDNLVYVTLDNGERNLCTADHLYMLRDGSYCEAEKLKSGMALMPLYTSTKKTTTNRKSTHDKIRYDETVKHPNGKTSLTYHLADEWNLKFNPEATYLDSDDVINRHHIDRDTTNNYPSNIMRMTARNHRNFHAQDFDKSQQFYREYMSDKMKEQSDDLSERAKAMWVDDEYRAKFPEDHHRNMRLKQIANGQMNSEHWEEYWKDDDNRKAASERTTKFFEEHPEAKVAASEKAKAQWDDEELKKWRSAKTRQQMNDPENVKRKVYSQETTRINKSIIMLNEVGVDAYPSHQKGNRTVYQLTTLIKKMAIHEECDTFTNVVELLESDIYTYNHKVVKVERYEGEPIPVYDIEVEGDTHNFALASGVFVHNSAKQARSRDFQAIMPLRGKILNTWEVHSDQVLGSSEIHDISVAIGVDPGSDDISKLRYGKICILADADSDGYHIATLICALFLKHFRPLVEAGHIFVAMPPLFRIDVGKEKFYALDREERDAILKRCEKKRGKVSVTRFKGLGEMNPLQLRESSMSPDTRRLLQLTIDDGDAADEMLNLLLGKKNAAQRKQWLEDKGDIADT